MQVSKVGISYLDYYIPTNGITVDDFLTGVGNSFPSSFSSQEEYSDFLKGILKLESIRMEGTLEDHQMIEELIQTFFLKNAEIKADHIDVLIVSQETKAGQTENIANLIQYKCGLNNAFILHVSGNQCSNMEVAVSIASSLLKSNLKLNNILIVGSTKISQLKDRMIDTYGVYGDGAGIILVNRSPRIAYIDSYLINDSSYYDLSKKSASVLSKIQNYLKCIRTLLQQNNITEDQLTMVLIQNANPLLIVQCLNSLGIKKDRIFFDNLGKYGHLDSLDFIINMKDYSGKRAFEPQGYVLCFGIGYYGTYMASLYQL